MGPSEKSFKQVKDILGKLDRSIDELRSRRSTPADPPSVAHAPGNAAPAAQGINSFTGLLGNGSSSANGPRLAGTNGSGNGSSPSYQNGNPQPAPARATTSADPTVPQPAAQPRKSQYGRATPLPPLAG